MSADLPAYADVVSAQSREADHVAIPRARWPFVVLAAIGTALVLVPLALGMFVRAAQGQRMLAEFAPFMSSDEVASLRADLDTIDAARQNVLALQASGRAPVDTYTYVDAFVRDYPAIDENMSAMLDTMVDNVGNYEKLTSLPPFGAMPWFFVLPGVALVGIGVRGVRKAEEGKRTRVLTAASLTIAAGLVVAPIAFGIFTHAPAANPLLSDFSSIMTDDEVRSVQGYFVTLVGGAGELDSRYTKAVRAADPGADLTGIDRLEARWQPMTSEFAGLIGVMNDNVENFDAVVALNDSTTSLGFSALPHLGWFFVIPGLAVGATVGIAHHRSRKARS